MEKSIHRGSGEPQRAMTSRFILEEARSSLCDTSGRTLRMIQSIRMGSCIWTIDDGTDDEKRRRLYSIATGVSAANTDKTILQSMSSFLAGKRSRALRNDAERNLSQISDHCTSKIRQRIVFVSGSFPVSDTRGVLDRFLIEVEIPPRFPHSLPVVREVGHRIPWIADRHMYSNGIACLLVEEDWWVSHPNRCYNLIEFLDGPVRNYFLGQAHG